MNKVDLDEETKQAIEQKINELEKNKLNIMITGATASGKSSTINALFNEEVAQVGQGVDPETMTIKKYELDNIILWDTPGLGDSPEQDKYYAKNIVELLNKKDDSGKALVDLVLVVVDGSAKDMRTSFELINEVIIPNISDKNRILVAINQCDMAMKGRGWDNNLNIPKEDLIQFLDEKVESVKKRIYESTGVEIKPIYYSALYKYNISKLLCYIIKSTPDEKRIIYIDKINKNPEIRGSICSVFNLMKVFGFTESTLTSKNALIPIIYYIYHRKIYHDFSNRKSFEQDRKIIKEWLNIALIKRIFGGQADNVLTNIRSIFTEDINNYFIKDSIALFPKNLISEKLKGTTKDMTMDDDYIDNLLLTQKDNGLAFSILSLLYPNLDYKNGNFHKDHLYPEDFFKGDKYLKQANIPQDKNIIRKKDLL